MAASPSILTSAVMRVVYWIAILAIPLAMVSTDAPRVRLVLGIALALVAVGLVLNLSAARRRTTR